MATSPIVPLETRDRLIVALDFPSVQEAKEMVRALGPAVNFYQIGSALMLAHGLELASELIREEKRVFLDAKLLDDADGVFKAVRDIAALGATFVSVHAYPPAM